MPIKWKSESNLFFKKIYLCIFCLSHMFLSYVCAISRVPLYGCPVSNLMPYRRVSISSQMKENICTIYQIRKNVLILIMGHLRTELLIFLKQLRSLGKPLRCLRSNSSQVRKCLKTEIDTRLSSAERVLHNPNTKISQSTSL